MTALISPPVPSGSARADSPFSGPRGADRFSFVLISDRTGGARPGVFERGLAVTDLLAPDFAIQLGDLIEGYSSDAAVIEAEWDRLDAMTDRLQTPLFRVAGNHDVSNDVQRAIWRRRYGATWSYFRYGDVLFCLLDTQDPPAAVSDQPLPGPRADAAQLRAWTETQPAALSANQLADVERVLGEHADAAWTVLCMHMPLWQGDHPAWRRLRAMLGRRRYTAFAGHVHNYRHDRIGGRSHVRLGPTGGMFVLGAGPGEDRMPDGNVDHVTQVTMTARGPAVANVMLDGVRDLDGRLVGTPELSDARPPG